MGLTTKGYVLEPPRISTSNNPFTSSPNVAVGTSAADQAAYAAAYPTGSEPNPRVEYLVLVLPDGTSTEGRFLRDARFGWTKNEGTTQQGFQRFDFDSTSQSFKPLVGAAPIALGTINATLNTNRLKVLPPVGVLSPTPAPFRLAYGPGSGTTLTVNLVTSFSAPGTLPVNTVEILKAGGPNDGQLNWSSALITNPANEGLAITWQRQQFYSFTEATGSIGTLPSDPTVYPNYLLMLSPLPATGQSPLVRLGAGIWLTPTEYPTEVAMTAAASPAAGTFYWAADTGRLRFSPSDITTYGGATVYYDGVLIARDLQLPRWSIGNVSGAPLTITTLPSAGADLIFYLPGVNRQYASVIRYDPLFTFAFPSGGGTFGTVEVLPALPPGVSGQVKFSQFDQILYAGQPVEFIQGDLPIERGVYLRLFRTPVNRDATGSTPDVTRFYITSDATVASPITGMPMVYLPSVPVDSPLFPTKLKVTQGTGSYLNDDLPRLDIPSPAPGLGYFIDLATKQVKFANRKNAQTTLLPISVGATPLDDSLILGSNYSFDLEVAPNTGFYTPLTLGQDAILDPTPGVLTFATTTGQVQQSGFGVFTGATFADASSSLTTKAGDLLVVTAGTAEGVYKLAAGALNAGVTVDVPEANLPWGSGTVTAVPYEVRRSQEIIADTYWNPVAIIDPNTKVEKIRLVGSMQNDSTVVPADTATYVDDTTLSTTVDLIAAGVTVGDTLEMTSGAEAGTFRTITVVEQFELQVATPFTVLPVPPALPTDTYRIVRRLRAPLVIAQTVLTNVVGTFPSSTTVTSTTDFLAAGVRVGDTLKLTTGPESGTSRAITAVTANTLTVVSPWAFIVGPQTFDIIRTDVRFRFGQTTFSKTTAIVASDAGFTPSATLPSGTVEISQVTGNLNFSAADLTVPPLNVYWVRRLKPLVDYQMQPLLAFINFTERFLQGEEALVTYIPLDGNGDPLPLTEERVSFQIRKELTQPSPRPVITNAVKFNSAGRTVATNPFPAVFRGGRPQVINEQCTVNTTTSTVTFLPDQGYMTDTLPHGDKVETDERIYVDYSVYEAVGGERNVTLLNNMQVATISIVEDATSFEVLGDQTLAFPAGYLLKVERDYVYRIASTTYDAPTNTTTVNLSPGEMFAENLVNPSLFLASSPTPLSATTYSQSFFTAESATFQVVPRGMNRLRVYGDRTATYRTGVIVYVSGNPLLPGYYQDFYLVSGATYEDGWTEVTVQSNAMRQYAQGQAYLRYSNRPILADGATQATTARTPILTAPGPNGLPVDLPLGVYRKTAGQVGSLLLPPKDGGTAYTLDQSGSFKYTLPLSPNEEIGLFYTGNRNIRAGVRLRYSYTHTVVPDETNGLLNQILLMDYTTFSADSFYFRVETLTNFKGEVQNYLTQQVKGNVPASGPRTSNASSPVLYEQGRESVYFPEGHIANQDLVARGMLKYLNDNVNHLEDTLQSIDGRIVGANDGRFKFDGKVNNPIRDTPAQVTNQLDDRFLASLFPVEFTFPGFVFDFKKRYQALYKAGKYSRVYPTHKDVLMGVTTGGINDSPPPEDATEILDFKQTDLFSVPPIISKRYPRALVIKDAAAGDTTLYVDNATGSADYFRPSFATIIPPPIPVIVFGPDGTLLVTDGLLPPIPPAVMGPMQVVTGVGSPERLLLAAGAPVAIPAGSTVVLCVTGPTPDTVYQKNYRNYQDVTLDYAAGKLLYVEPYWPFAGGSDPVSVLVPEPFEIKPPNSKEFLQMNDVGIFNTLTAPRRFPALDGKAENDSNDLGLPLRYRTFDCEQAYIGRESDAITALLAATTSAVEIAGVSTNPVAPFTTLTYLPGWPLPAIQQYDLVRFTTGPNASAGFRRITAITPTTVTVDGTFPNASTGENVVITAAPNVTTAAGATVDLTGTQVTAAALLTTQPGQTLIFTTGLNVGVRRQIAAILPVPPNTVLLDHPVPVPGPAGTGNVRVSNHLSTYSEYGALTAAAQGTLEVVLTNDHPPAPKVDSEVLGIQRFFDGDVVTGTEGMLTDIVPSQAGTVSADTLTGTTDFIAAGVKTSHFVYIETGANAGFYKVTSIPSPTTIKVDPAAPFPVAGAVTYRVVKAFSLDLPGLTDLFSVLSASQTWANTIIAWQATLAQTEPVYPLGVLDPLVYANPFLTSTFTARQATVSARVAYVNDTTNGPVPKLTNVLANRDKLYDKRYVWIDGRVNVEKGFVYMQARAVDNRNANLVKQVNDLIKLLSLEDA